MSVASHSVASHSVASHSVVRHFTVAEFVVAAFVTASWLIWSVVVLTMADLNTVANAPAVGLGREVAIKVRPVLDELPLLKLGGKKMRPVLPEMWRKKAKPKHIKKRLAQASTKAKNTPAKTSDPKLDVGKGDEAIRTDDQVAKESDDDEQSRTDSSDASDEAVGGGSAAGSEHGTETDPLKARAASLYKSRINVFLSSGLNCAMVPDDVRKTCRPSATVSWSGTGTVTGFQFVPCNQTAMDQAARSAIQSKVGRSFPPTPENHPDLLQKVQNPLRVTFVCPSR